MFPPNSASQAGPGGDARKRFGEDTMRHRSRSVARLLGVMILLTSWVGTGRAQTQGGINGRVTDSSGAAIPGATVTVTNTATSGTRNTTTNAEGLYTFPALPPGFYELKVELQAFKTAEIRSFKVDVQQTVRVDVPLQVGALDETVTVVGKSILLNTQSTTLGTVIENKVVTELPLNGRQYLNLVAIAPNVNVLSPAAGQAAARLGGERAQQAISAGGQRIFFNYYTLDGVSNTDPNFNNYIALPSIDAIQEFKVQTGVYPAEFGHQSTQVNVVTKSGGNAFHGSLFEFLRDETFDAKPYVFTSVRPDKSPFKWNDYGFEADGPVFRDKLFFMGNFEGLRRRQTTLSTFTVPSAKMFTGDFSEILPGTVIYDPLTGQPFPGNVIPANRIDPVSQSLLQYYHPATLPGLTNNYVQDNSQPFDRKGYVIRADFNESSSSSQWMARYNWGDDTQSNQGLGLAGSKTVTNYKQWGASNTRILSSTLVNDARFGYTKFFNSIGTLSAFTNDVVGALKIPNLKSGDPVTWGIPDVSFTGFNDIGDITDGPFAVDNNTLQFVDKLTWVKGRHNIGLGAEYDRQHFNEVGNQFSRGQFAFQANTTRNPANNTGGYAFAEFLLGQPFKTSVALAVAEGQFVRNVFHAFVDDNWKVTNNFTLLAGLRYELTPPFTNTLGNYFTVAIPTIDYSLNQPQSDWPMLARQGDDCTDPYAGLSLRWTVTPVACGNTLGMNNNLRETKYLNFAPRLGATYALGEKTVIRSGVGLYYMEDIGNAEYFDMARITAARVDTQASTTNLLTWANAAPGGGHCRGASYVDVGGCLRSRDAAHLAVSGQRGAAVCRELVSGVGLPRIAEPPSVWVPDPQPGRSRPAEQHQLARALPNLRRDLVCERLAHRALQRVQHQGDAPLRWRSRPEHELHVGQVDRQLQRHPHAGLRHAVPAGQPLPRMRDGALVIRRAPSLGDGRRLRPAVRQGQTGEHRQRRPGRHFRRMAVEHEHHDPERRSADALRRQGSIGHQQPGERPSELLGRGRRLCRRPLGDALVRPRFVRLGSRGPIRDRRAQFDNHAASAADRRVAGEEFPAAEWPPPSGQGRSLQRVQHSGVGRTQRKHPGGRGIPGRARERGASGLRRHHHDGPPDAPDSARAEVFVLSEEANQRWPTGHESTNASPRGRDRRPREQPCQFHYVRSRS